MTRMSRCPFEAAACNALLPSSECTEAAGFIFSTKQIKDYYILL